MTAPALSGGEGSALPRKPARAPADQRVPQTFVIRNGDPRVIEGALRALDRWQEGGDVLLTLERYEPKRSSAQHGLFWAWCTHLAMFLREAGQPACDDSVHDWILGTVYGWEDMGLGRTRPRRTLTRPHQMGKLAMIELLTRFEQEANTEFGCQLPRPATWDADLEELRKAKEAGKA